MSGLTHDSFVRHNLIHHIKRGCVNDNVAIWLDNMSFGWTAEDNIYYALEQGDMKLCAANLLDTVCRDNSVIVAPFLEPKEIIEGEPVFTVNRLQIENKTPPPDGKFETGQYLLAQAVLKNLGSTGVGVVHLFVGSRLTDSTKVAAVHGNEAPVRCRLRLATAGRRQISVEDSPPQTLNVSREALSLLYDYSRLSETMVPANEPGTASARLANIGTRPVTTGACLRRSGWTVGSRAIMLAPGAEKPSSSVSRPNRPATGCGLGTRQSSC